MQLAELLVQLLQVLIAHRLEVDQPVPGVPQRADQLVELQLHHHRVAVLGVLDEEDDQEGDDRRAGVDDELSGVRVAEERAGKGPADDDRNGQGEGPGLTHDLGRLVGEAVKDVLLHAPHYQSRLVCRLQGGLQDGRRTACYPLTLTDAFSRALLRCTALRSPKTVRVRPVFEEAFREFGLPERIRTDNGTPFASRGAGGLSRLSIWWEPGHPEQNGRRERMHRTLKQETVHPPAPTLRSQQVRFDAFRREYNEERPHEALANATPWFHYRRSYDRTHAGCMKCSTPTTSGRERSPPAVASVGAVRW